MHQSHFLLSAAARSLSVREIFALREEQAFELFRAVRWGRDGDPVCPDCGRLTGTGSCPAASSGAVGPALTPSR